LSEDVRPGGTYKTLAEQREVLTPAEERFERIRQTTGLFLGPIAFLIMYFLPLPLPRDQHTLTAALGCGLRRDRPDPDRAPDPGYGRSDPGVRESAASRIIPSWLPN
jgi:hypothetical protein